jgi:hypothetical protein
MKCKRKGKKKWKKKHLNENFLKEIKIKRLG